MAGRSAFPLATNGTQEPLSDAYGIGCAKGGKLQLRVHFKKSGHEKKGGIINAQPLPSLVGEGLGWGQYLSHRQDITDPTPAPPRKGRVQEGSGCAFVRDMS